jgi:hypothetical protein
VATVALVKAYETRPVGAWQSAERENVTRWSSSQIVGCIGRHGGASNT